MPFSHHSHSGQFCPGHARNTLEEVVQTAISKRMQTFCLTEHMPRHDQDRYPEEIGVTMESQFDNMSAYVQEALSLREKYKSQIELPLGFEIDYCRPEAGDLVRRLLSEHPFNFFMGSIHHVKAIPIDYDHETYIRARQACGGSDEDIFAAYYEEQYVMLQDLKPLVVGHFDLIRLKSDDPDGSFTSMPKVWSLINRNLDFIASYGGKLEINSAAVRKGMKEPYPKLEICDEFRRRGGRFCLSDDSHGVDQIAHSYDVVLSFLQEAQIDQVDYLQHVDKPTKSIDVRFPNTQFNSVSLQYIRDHPFWETPDRI